jgi:hypothetical protein
MFDPPSYVVATLREVIASFDETLPPRIRVSATAELRSERLGNSKAAAQSGMGQDVCRATRDKWQTPRRTISFNPGRSNKMDEDV